ncbi:MAG TPA: NADH-quinone oxidoreductase subunit A [Alphaproteobacteria bacterium]|nr:NADH-quinone oxidoreductase subunit A [Alphaproteobacteria bacterium]
MQSSGLWPFLVYAIAVLGLVASMLVLSAFLGERHRERATGDPYESGMVPTGSARQRFSAQFYLIAMFFVIFDLEAVFIFAWAIAAREVGWAGYGGLFVFVGILAVALLYEWRQGALDWAAQGRPLRLTSRLRQRNGLGRSAAPLSSSARSPTP